jgi:hypothetical protein
MYSKFRNHFRKTGTLPNESIEMKGVPFKYAQLLVEFGGNVFEKGLYTIHTFADSIKWTNTLSNYFNIDTTSIVSFGHDWMGRQFCISRNTNEMIYMFDPGTWESFHLDENLLVFHNETLVDFKVDNLASDLFEFGLQHLEATEISYNQCLGLVTPIFLNGKEELTNYAISDLEIYWDYMHQLYDQSNRIPDNTNIDKVLVNPFLKKG